jgi:hypothetical protein
MNFLTPSESSTKSRITRRISISSTNASRAIIENHPDAIESSRDDLMIFVDAEIASDDKLHIFSGDSRLC